VTTGDIPAYISYSRDVGGQRTWADGGHQAKDSCR